MIDIENVSVQRGARHILSHVSARAEQGKTLGLIGPNGAGKTSLLATLYKALKPKSGQVLIDGEAVSNLRRREVAHRVAVVAQQGESSLPLTVRDSVALGRLSKETALSYGNKSDRVRVEEALHRVGIGHLADRLTTELSGGELQRVLIARAIVQEAPHLLLDEPTNHLDIHHQYRILNLVRDISATTVIVLHDLNLAAQFCDELVLLDKGTVVAAGSPLDVLTPERVSQVYRIGAKAVTIRGRLHLLFDDTFSNRKESL